MNSPLPEPALASRDEMPAALIPRVLDARIRTGLGVMREAHHWNIERVDARRP